MEGTVMIDPFNEIEALNAAIDKTLSVITDTEPGTEEYTLLIDQLTKLTKVKDSVVSQTLKTLELNNKTCTEEYTHALKLDEYNHKTAQDAITGELKQRELDIRERELKNREAETSDANRLKLRELELKEREAEKPDRVSRETLAMIGANLAGIVAILGYEKFNVIASKAFSLVMKSR
jgi:hypothetical protein